MPCRSSKVCFEKLLILNVPFLAPFLASAEPGQTRLCSRLIEKVRFFICSSEWNCSGPQPPGSGGPQFVSELGGHSAGCVPQTPDIQGSFTRTFSRLGIVQASLALSKRFGSLEQAGLRNTLYVRPRRSIESGFIARAGCSRGSRCGRCVPRPRTNRRRGRVPHPRSG